MVQVGCIILQDLLLVLPLECIEKKKYFLFLFQSTNMEIWESSQQAKTPSQALLAYRRMDARPISIGRLVCQCNRNQVLACRP